MSEIRKVELFPRILSEHGPLREDIESILASFPQAIFVGDNLGITYANPAAVTLFGVNPSLYWPMTFREFILRSPLSHSHMGRMLASEEQPFSLALKGQYAVCDAHVKSGNVNNVIYQCAGYPVIFNNTLRGALVSYSDISDDRRTTNILARSNDELREFSMVVAHDIKEPLRLICTILQSISMRESIRVDGEIHRHINSAIDHSRRLQSLIDNLLSLATATEKRLQRSKVSCNELVNEALSVLEMAAKESKAVIKIGKLPEIYADKSHMALVFQNIISNALRYRCETRPLVVEIKGAQRLLDTIFSVQDNGIGIGPEHQKKIFAPFGRASEKRGHHGSGLGLAICRRIISRHNGSIWVENSEGGGMQLQIHHSSSAGGWGFGGENINLNSRYQIRDT